MFDSLISAFNSTSTFKLYPRLTYYVKTLIRNSDIATDRYEHSHGYENAGMTLLEKLLSDSHIYSDLLPMNESLFDLYGETINYIVPSLNHIIDPVQNRIIRTQDYFIKKLTTYKEEYFIPVSTANVEKDYLFNEDWGFWSNVRCLRLMHNNTHTLSFNINTDRVIYTRDCPSISVFTVDVALLILQYLVYLRTFKYNADTVDIVSYLHRYVIFPCLSSDLVSVWLIKIYKAILLDQLDINYKEVDVTDKYVSLNKLGTGFIAFSQDVTDLCNLLKSGNITPQTLFNSLYMTEKESASKRFKYLHHEVNIENLSQYNHLEFLSYMDWFTILVAILEKSPMSYNNSYKTNLLKDLNILELKKFYNQPGISVYTKNYIMSEFNQLKTITTNL